MLQDLRYDVTRAHILANGDLSLELTYKSIGSVNFDSRLTNGLMTRNLSIYL